MLMVGKTIMERLKYHGSNNDKCMQVTELNQNISNYQGSQQVEQP
jgi:hypothetical protein